MKAQKGYYCSGSPENRTRCSGFCKGCSYGLVDAYGIHKDEDYYVPPKETTTTYVPSYRRPFVSDDDLITGKVELY